MAVRRSSRERVLVAAGASVALAAALLAMISFLAWRIERRAMETEEALDGIRDRTGKFFDLANINIALDRMTKDLRSMRTEGGK